MRPVLFYLFGLPVSSYAVFAVVAYFAGMAYFWPVVRSRGHDTAHAVNLSMIFFIGGLAGARLLSLLIAYERVIEEPSILLTPWEGGMVFFGGFIAATALSALYVRWKGLSFPEWADMAGPGVMLVLAAGRVGCLLNGCCFGKVAPRLPWGIVYPPSHPTLGIHMYPVHPTPVYEFLAAIAIAVVTAVYDRRPHRPGRTFIYMVMLYSAARFAVEFYRADFRGHAFGLSTSQLIGIGAVAACLATILLQKRRSRSETGTRAATGEEGRA